MKRVLVLLACSALVTACQPTPLKACPAVNSPQGVVFTLPSGGHFDVPVEVRACVEQDCVVRDLTSPQVSTPLVVAGSAEATAARSVSARLTITDLSSREVRFDASTQVTFREIASAPCDADSGGYQASVVATADGGLVPG
jgi:hypothetical protein